MTKLKEYTCFPRADYEVRVDKNNALGIELNHKGFIRIDGVECNSAEAFLMLMDALTGIAVKQKAPKIVYIDDILDENSLEWFTTYGFKETGRTKTNIGLELEVTE